MFPCMFECTELQNKVNNLVSSLLLHKVLREEVDLLQIFMMKAFISKSRPLQKSAIQNAFIMHVL